MGGGYTSKSDQDVKGLTISTPSITGLLWISSVYKRVTSASMQAAMIRASK
jgi:hypothetical protein